MTEAREEEYKTLLTPWIDPSFWLNALVQACWGQHPKAQANLLSLSVSSVR